MFRGVAVALMVADHAVIASAGPNWLRLGPTRLAMPMFALVAGSLVYGRSDRVPARLWIAGAGLGLVVWPVLLGQVAVDVLVWLAVGLGLAVAGRAAPWHRLWLLGVLVAAVLQPTTWPLRVVGVAGYQPGVVVGLVVVGALVADWFAPAVDRWCSDGPAWLGWLGRHSFRLYVAHLCALALLVLAVRGELGL